MTVNIKSLIPASGRVLRRARRNAGPRDYTEHRLIGWAVLDFIDDDEIWPVYLDKGLPVVASPNEAEHVVLPPGEEIPEEWDAERRSARYREEVRAEAKAAEREQRRALREEGLL